MSITRHAEIWFPGYLRDRLRRVRLPKPQRVWLAITDHYEPYWKHADDATARERVARWWKAWPEIAKRSVRDSAGRAPKYTFFYPEEEYRPELLDRLAEMTHAGIADVEIHIHHDREGRQNFIDRMSSFRETLHHRHGLLRIENGSLTFGFVHGNWALDNSLPHGERCGLNDEITLLRELGCYADFTMPSADSPSQSRIVNTIYWCKDDPNAPKSYDWGVEIQAGGKREGDLLMIPGPLGLRWHGRWEPRMEAGELASYDPPTPYRAKRWLDLSPRFGGDIFIKLFTHGTQERHSQLLLQNGLEQVFSYVADEAQRRHCQFYFVSAWEMYLAIDALRQQGDPVQRLGLGNRASRKLNHKARPLGVGVSYRIHGSVKYLNPATELPEIQRVWTALDGNVSSYFLSWPWIENWLNTLPGQAKVRLVVWENEQQPLVAFFLGSRLIRRHGFVSSRAIFLTETGIPDCDRLCLEQNTILTSPGVSADLPKILEWLPEPWDEFFLSAVPANSPLLLGSPKMFRIHKKVNSAYVDLEKVRAMGDYLRLLNPNTRWQIRRAYRGYTEQYGPVRLEVASTLQEAHATYSELKQLHQARWQARGQLGAFCSEYFDNFHCRLIERRFKSGEIQLLKVLAGNTVIGCLYSFIINGRVSYYQSGFAFDKDNRLKPGYVCHAEAIRHNAIFGMGQYDFLGGADRYKLSLATDTQDVIWAVVQKPKFAFALEQWLQRWKQSFRGKL